MERILIVGAGGHAQVVADILIQARNAGENVNAIGFLDDDLEAKNLPRLPLPILGQVPDLEHIAHDAIVIAIGENHTRRDLFDQMQHRGERIVIAKHPQAVVAPDVSMGVGVVICVGAVICPGSSVGDNVILNTGCTVDHHNCIGDHAHIAPGVHLGGEVQIGEGALVGIGAAVLPGRHIGPWSVVGGGAVVVDDIPAGVVAFGVPAKIMRFVGEERSQQ